jgi:hypothetical protein
MLKHIQLAPLLAGLVIGIIAILFVKPEQKINYKYPTPDNAKELTFKDKNGVCFQYLPKEVDCDKNEAKLKAFPLSL